MPTARRLAQGAPKRVEVNLQPLTIPHVGNRHSGNFPVGDQANEVFGRGARFISFPRFFFQTQGI